MARPGRAEAIELAELEDLAARLDEVRRASAIIRLRVSQGVRRIVGNRDALRVLVPALEEVERITNETTECQRAVAQILAARQVDRARANKKRRRET